MSQIKAIALNKQNTIALTQFVVLIGIATVAPLFHNQWTTGPIVNATLFVAAALLGTHNAILVGLFPSLIAMSVGLLPAPLAPMIPFIMVSNAILIITFSYFWKKQFWGGMLSASILKFGFLFATSTLVTGLLLKPELAGKVAVIMSWPQLATALLGGVIAFGVLKVMKKV